MSKPAALTREAYRYFRPIQTRWMDNDVYGHINNVNYYSYFDTLVNGFLLSERLLDYERGEIIGLVVETQCNYFASIAFPDVIDAGLRVTHLGGSSVRYEVGLFREGEPLAAAQGHFVHVYVGRESRRPVALSEAMRTALGPLVVDPQ